jgi:hypothetical protein
MKEDNKQVDKYPCPVCGTITDEHSRKCWRYWVDKKEKQEKKDK